MIDPKNLLYAIAAVSAAAMLASCEPVNPEPEPEPEPQPVTKTLTFVLPADGSKTAWVAGDKIVVHGEYAAQQVTVALESGDISADGKTATKTVENLYPYEREDCTSNLYASWPAEAVANLRHCFFYSGFNNTNTLLMAACNDANDRFEFKQLTSEITFQVKGDYDSYALTGRKDAVVGYEYYQVKITDNEQNFNQYRENPLVTISGRLEGGAGTVQHIYLPDSRELPGGYELKFFKDGNAVKALTDKSEVSIKRGNVLSLGDITAGLKDFETDIDVTTAVNLCVAEPANCYLVYKPGTYKFPASKGNSTKSIGLVENIKVLWETWNNDEEVTPKSLIQATKYEGGYVYFITPDTFHAGNALIAALDENETILWSWHIWMPETAPTTDTFGYSKSCQIMGRNLGALIDTEPGAVADPRSFGLLYQWGRKDPFLGVRAAGSDESATFSGTAMTFHEGQMTQNQSKDDLEETAANPTVFIIEPDLDWNTVDDREAWGDQERSNKKTIYDPCPEGYMVAGRKRQTFFEPASNPIANWKFDDTNYYFQMGNPVSTLPLCGYIKPDGTYATGEALVWNTHMDHDTVNLTYCQYVADGTTIKGQKCRSIAGSVRCETI